MISSSEIELLAYRIFKKSTVSVEQVNKTTIRIKLTKEVFIDIFQSIRDTTKFAIHAKSTAGRIFRLDCRPERKYQKLSTFPWHFHQETEDNVVTSPFSTNKRTAITQFLNFIKETGKLKEEN